MEEQKRLPGFGKISGQKARALARDFSNLSTGEVAAAFDVTSQAVWNWNGQGCPVRKADGRNFYTLPVVIKWRRARDLERAHISDGDALLANEGESSDALERFRSWKAELAKLEFQKRDGTLIVKADVISQWRQAAARLRTALENIERQHGREVGDAIRDAIEQTTRDLEMV